MKLFTSVEFQSAHRLPNVPEWHKCKNLHGHRYKLTIEVTGDIDPKTGWLIDYWDLTNKFQPIFDQLDHHCLNDIVENPTVENLIVWIWYEYSNLLSIPRLDIPVKLSRLVLMETEHSGCEYTGE